MTIGISCLETCGHLVVSVGYCTVVLIPSVCRRLEHFTGVLLLLCHDCLNMFACSDLQLRVVYIFKSMLELP